MKFVPQCRLCETRHYSTQPHKLIGGPVAVGEKSFAVLDKAGARALTDRIKQAVANVGELLEEARTVEAWRLLGYATWEEYVEREFGFSLRRAQQLLAVTPLLRALNQGEIPFAPATEHQLQTVSAEARKRVTKAVAVSPEAGRNQLEREVARAAPDPAICEHVYACTRCGHVMV